MTQACLCRDLAWTHALLEGKEHHQAAEAKFEQAIALAQQAREISRFQADGDTESDRAWREFHAELALERTVLCLENGDLEGAQQWIERERAHLAHLERHAPTDDDRLRCQRQGIRTDYYEAEIYFEREDYGTARDRYDRVFRKAREIGWGQFCAYSSNWLAEIALGDDSPETAMMRLNQTARYLEEQNDTRSRAFFHQSLARVCAAQEKWADAQKAARLAIQDFSQLGQDSRVYALMQEFESAPAS